MFFNGEFCVIMCFVAPVSAIAVLLLVEFIVIWGQPSVLFVNFVCLKGFVILLHKILLIFKLFTNLVSPDLHLFKFTLYLFAFLILPPCLFSLVAVAICPSLLRLHVLLVCSGLVVNPHDQQ